MDIKPVSSQSPMVGSVTGNIEQAPAVRSGATTSPVAEPTAVDRISLSSAATTTVVNAVNSTSHNISFLVSLSFRISG